MDNFGPKPKDPSVLENVPSLAKSKQKQIAEQISANQESEKIMIRLHAFSRTEGSVKISFIAFSPNVFTIF
jgi:hypothetical protein